MNCPFGESAEAVLALTARTVADRDASVVPLAVGAPTSSVVAPPAAQPILGQVHRGAPAASSSVVAHASDCLE